ncbi:diphosphomevalonate decarboxylase-like isoform X1 [Schistocerca piceifrons]|uniref:diphosphomevalonate decarboxylase-like isoform X1 n=2 Tax=Schistocerca piceifrons TaxID=274613 RepID=UPI001F5E6C9F|nr:diphosphomevalonate decarboxylase-like isoform X1 [Schistocerca piceifrons]
MKIVTCVAPVNIAVIKYWGKRDDKLILPLNDSVSTTLSTEHLCAKTTIMISSEFPSDRLWLNGREENCENPRIQNCLREVRKRAAKSGNNENMSAWNVHICSENNFPTAAGLASSAAGYACLVYALSRIYEIDGDISAIARQGSGSACRSVLGGFVQWNKGDQDDGSDSLATQLAPANHWPEMRILILVVHEKHKKISSKIGMEQSVKTSELLKYRVSHCIPQRIQDIKQAILNKDFERFSEITMKDSNQFHAVCLDTFPPAVYMNDVSHAIVNFVHCYNKLKGHNALAYTFDAGPNACLYMKEHDVPKVLGLLSVIFPFPGEEDSYIKGIPINKDTIPQEMQAAFGMEQQMEGSLKYIIHTRLGNGPKELKSQNEHLLTESGVPKNLVV